MLHAFKYTLIKIVRNRSMLGWNLLFPLILSTMFSLAFTGLDADEQLNRIHVALVSENASASVLREVMASVNNGEMFDITDASEAEAMKLLGEKEIVGIIYDESPARLTVSGEMQGNRLDQSIIDIFVNEYNLSYETITKVAMTSPENIEKITAIVTGSHEYNEWFSFTDGDMSQKLSYFFNLIAMSCLFASNAGIVIATRHQANLSELGARRCVSPMKRISSYLGEISAEVVSHYACVVAAILYINFVLGIDFGKSLPYSFITAFFGTFLGVSMGFMIGSIGRLNEGTKSGIVSGVSMLCCFLSGLMSGAMRMAVAAVAPWFNRINPAALVTDCFYTLSICNDIGRYIICLVTMFAMTVLFWIIGGLIARRRKYAAI